MSLVDPSQPRTGPLSGVVVTDMSRVLAGPYSAMLLADMGATVIKVESPAGDDTRSFAPPVHPETEQSTYFQSINRNKRSITLDFADAADREVLRTLIARSDVVIENFKAGSLSRFGLDAQTLTTELPALIWASVTGFGTGAGAKYAGYDLMVQALSGFMDTTGPADGDPHRAGFAVFDVLTGMHLTIGILAALRHREATGRGQLVEADLLTSAFSSMANQVQSYAAAGVIPRRMGNEHPSLYPYEPFPTADAPLVIAVGNNNQFQRLCAVLAIPAVAQDPRFATNPLRNSHREALRGLLIEALSVRGAHDWFDSLTAAGVPAAPIQNVADGVRFAEQIGLDPVIHAGGTLPMMRNPLTFSDTPVDYPLAPPHAGEHSDEIREALGLPRKDQDA